MENADSASVINLKSLGASLALLIISIAVTTALVAALIGYDQQTDQALKQALAQQAETRARLARAHDDEQEIRAKIAKYQELTALGRTATERRLDWVETLRHIRESRRLLGLEYEISPQQPLDAKNPVSGGFAFLSSPMKLDLPLLHENDLLGLLDDLATHVQALTSVRQCRIERMRADGTTPNPAPLKASCTIDWITLQERP